MKLSRIILCVLPLLSVLLFSCQKAISAPEADIWLGEAKPNPMPEGANTSITYWVVDSDDDASLVILNSLGQEVYYKSIQPGYGTLTWNGKDNHGRVCAEGVYYYRLQSDSQYLMNKLIIIR